MHESNRRYPVPLLLILLIQLLVLGTALQGNGGLPASNASSASGIKHVVLVMMENQNYANLIGNPSTPYINELAGKYATSTNYYGIQYPSLPNYIEITSGSNGGITTDCSSGPGAGGCETSNTNIFSLLQSKGLAWKSYEESMPSPCYTSDSGAPSSGGYIVHHNPVVYYTDLSSVCAQNDIPLGSVTSRAGPFFDALQNDSLPNFSFVTPNSCDNMHNCPVSAGDSWLSKFVPDIISSSSFSSTIIIITWDSGNCASPCNQTLNGGGHVLTLVVGPQNLVNYGKYAESYNHYSVLSTIESIFGLGNLGRNDASSTPMSALFGSGNASTTTTTTSTTLTTTKNSTPSQNSTSVASQTNTSPSELTLAIHGQQGNLSVGSSEIPAPLNLSSGVSLSDVQSSAKIQYLYYNSTAVEFILASATPNSISLEASKAPVSVLSGHTPISSWIYDNGSLTISANLNAVTLIFPSLIVTGFTFVQFLEAIWTMCLIILILGPTAFRFFTRRYLHSTGASAFFDCVWSVL